MSNSSAGTNDDPGCELSVMKNSTAWRLSRDFWQYLRRFLKSWKSLCGSELMRSSTALATTAASTCDTGLACGLGSVCAHRKLRALMGKLVCSRSRARACIDGIGS